MELKKYRRIAGLTQGQLAKKSGVHVTLISRLERGQRRTASYESIVRLAHALNLEPEELLPVEIGSEPMLAPADNIKRPA
jgi:transcriptional regulator with XRE-family HTH domain